MMLRTPKYAKDDPRRYPYAKTRLRWIGTWSPREQKVRLFRLIWCKGKPGTTGSGYSASLTLGLQNPLKAGWLRLCGEDKHLKARRNRWRLSVCGIVLHHQKSYGGWIT